MLVILQKNKINIMDLTTKLPSISDHYDLIQGKHNPSYQSFYKVPKVYHSHSHLQKPDKQLSPNKFRELFTQNIIKQAKQVPASTKYNHHTLWIQQSQKMVKTSSQNKKNKNKKSKQAVKLPTKRTYIDQIFRVALKQKRPAVGQYSLSPQRKIKELKCQYQDRQTYADSLIQKGKEVPGPGQYNPKQIQSKSFSKLKLLINLQKNYKSSQPNPQLDNKGYQAQHQSPKKNIDKVQAPQEIPSTFIPKIIIPGTFDWISSKTKAKSNTLRPLAKPKCFVQQIANNPGPGTYDSCPRMKWRPSMKLWQQDYSRRLSHGSMRSIYS